MQLDTVHSATGVSSQTVPWSWRVHSITRKSNLHQLANSITRSKALSGTLPASRAVNCSSTVRISKFVHEMFLFLVLLTQSPEFIKRFLRSELQFVSSLIGPSSTSTSEECSFDIRLDTLLQCRCPVQSLLWRPGNCIRSTGPSIDWIIVFREAGLNSQLPYSYGVLNYPNN